MSPPRKTDDRSSTDNVAKQGFAMKKVPSDLDVIVIGSGMGGLSVAAILAKEGKKVLVLEQHDIAGGNTHTFEERGFEFDTGLHYIGGNIGRKGSPLRRQMDYITDGKVEWAPMNEEYDVAIHQSIDGTSERVPIHRSWRILIPRLKELFPNDHEAIDKHFELVKQVQRWIPVHFALRKLPTFLFAAKNIRLPSEYI